MMETVSSPLNSFGPFMKNDNFTWSFIGWIVPSDAFLKAYIWSERGLEGENMFCERRGGGVDPLLT